MNRVYDKLKDLQKNLIHVTEFENLESIFKSNGLFSLNEVQNKGIHAKFITSESSRDIDVHKHSNKINTGNYVRLAYTPLYDMFPARINSGALVNPAIIVINPEILKEKSEILFSTANAISNDAVCYKQNEIGDYLDWEKILSSRNAKTAQDKQFKDARQSEVLIPNKIELEYFSKIIVENNNNIDDLKKYNIPIYKEKVKEMIEQFG